MPWRMSSGRSKRHDGPAACAGTRALRDESCCVRGFVHGCVPCASLAHACVPCASLSFASACRADAMPAVISSDKPCSDVPDMFMAWPAGRGGSSVPPPPPWLHETCVGGSTWPDSWRQLVASGAPMCAGPSPGAVAGGRVSWPLAKRRSSSCTSVRSRVELGGEGKGGEC
eukprot:365325-Chlamydomonas_euryale.AAC.39